MSSGYTVAAGANVVHLPRAAALVPGTVLATAFSAVGPHDAPVVVVLGGISAQRHAADESTGERGWWSSIVGPGAAVDTLRYRVISFDWIGGPEAPLAQSPNAALPALQAQPAHAAESVPTTRLQAAALAAILDRLDIAEVHTIVGASYGGLVAQAFAEVYPQRVQRLALLCCAHKADPRARALRHVQREILRFADSAGRGKEGVALARSLALLGYRTGSELRERFATTSAASIDAWLATRGAAFAQRFDAQHYLALSASIDAHSSDPALLRTPLHAWAVTEDELVPLQDVQELVRLCGATATLHVAHSRYGHDAFLKETAAVSSFLNIALQCAAAPQAALVLNPTEVFS